MAETGKACGFERPLEPNELTSIIKDTDEKTSNEEFLSRLRSAAARPVPEPPKTTKELRKAETERWNQGKQRRRQDAINLHTKLAGR